MPAPTLTSILTKLNRQDNEVGGVGWEERGEGGRGRCAKGRGSGGVGANTVYNAVINIVYISFCILTLGFFVVLLLVGVFAEGLGYWGVGLGCWLRQLVLGLVVLAGDCGSRDVLFGAVGCLGPREEVLKLLMAVEGVECVCLFV